MNYHASLHRGRLAVLTSALLLTASLMVGCSQFKRLNPPAPTPVNPTVRDQPIDTETAMGMVLGSSDVPAGMDQLSLSAPAGGPYSVQYIDPRMATDSAAVVGKIIAVTSDVSVSINPQSARTLFDQERASATQEVLAAIHNAYQSVANIHATQQPTQLKDVDRQTSYRVTFTENGFDQIEYWYRMVVNYATADVTVTSRVDPDGGEPSTLRDAALVIAQNQADRMHQVIDGTSTPSTVPGSG